jgi:hypothetical protein
MRGSQLARKISAVHHNSSLYERYDGCAAPGTNVMRLQVDGGGSGLTIALYGDDTLEGFAG